MALNIIGWCNDETNLIVQESVDEDIAFYSKTFSTKDIDIEFALVKAICRQESRLNPYTIRFEKNKVHDTNYLKHIEEKYRSKKYSYCSLGIMQVMFGTAVWLGFTGTPNDLITQDNSLIYGIRYLIYLIKRFNRIDKVVSSYNQGTPRFFDTDGDGIKDPGEDFKNQEYVDFVRKYYLEYGGKVKF